MDQAFGVQFPEGDDTPFVRTDFSDDEAWRRVVEASTATSPDGFQAYLHVVDDRRHEGADLAVLLKAADRSGHSVFIVADARTIADPEMPLLCLDTSPPDVEFPKGEPLRLVPKHLWSLQNNISIANMDWEGFANEADPDGVIRTLR